jgi:CheY-like chemotaxis protein
MRRFPGSFNAAGGDDCHAWWVQALRCLVVDDNPEFLEAARSLLDQQGISVVGVAANSAEAIERAAELQPDVVLVDVHLGQENGLQLARRIAGFDREGLPRVILISSYPEGDLGEALPTAPTIEFVSKTDLSARAIRNALGLPSDDQTGR